MIVSWLKALHVLSIAIWTGGLIWLPGLLIHGRGKARAEIVHIHRFGRFGYDVIVSPCAVVAVGTGTALIFVVGVAEGWFYAKLAAVAGMVVIHMLIGNALDWEQRRSNAPGRPARIAMATTSAVLAAVVLWLVLHKPDIDTAIFPWWLRHGIHCAERAVALISSALSFRSMSSSSVFTPT
jgi:protoporphyrinogen IX oxidase